jgi:hypothetical protein
LCERTPDHKLYEREKGIFKQGENVLLRELFKATVALFALEKSICIKTSKAKRAWEKVAGVLL